MSEVDEVMVGTTSCHFLSWSDFKKQIRLWLEGSQGRHIVTLNPEMVLRAEHDGDFRTAIHAADLRVPDGAGLVWARWYLRSPFWALWPSLATFPFITVERIPGVEALLEVARQCAERDQGVYLLGGTPRQNSRAAKRLAKQFPSLTFHRAADHVFDAAGPAEILADIREKQPAALFVAYGAPKQALWIQRHLNTLPSVRLAMGVGGAFAILAEEKPRAPRWLRQLNLEWLWRLALEPSRLKRIYKATIEFPRLIHRQKQQS